jgi:propionyl-CoA carboxylase beta chain
MEYLKMKLEITEYNCETGIETIRNATVAEIAQKEIDAAENPLAKLQEKDAEYAAKFANPYGAAARGFIDEVIKPEETRLKLIRSFKMLENKAVSLPRKKHGNIPL